MFGLAKTSTKKPELYTTGADFCRIFEKDMNRLYLLSFLLTGNHSAAERCFVQGLADSKESNPVFKEWAESWARRTIVQNAIHMVRPKPTDVSASDGRDSGTVEPAEVAAILGLPAFDRFAYVLSVLEGYPLQECALLLDCTRGEVVEARMRALQEVVRSVELHDKTAGIHMEKPTQQDGARLNRFSHLAATA